MTTATALVSTGLVVASVPGYAATPKTPRFGAAIENLSPYQPQTRCHPVAQPGVLKFRALILATYKGTGDDGIVRACSVGGTSEHKDGRAWDWAVSYKNPHQVAQVHALFNWLFATDAYGHKYAMARRLGLMYIIWDKHIWGTYAAAAGWRNYKCSGVTLCHQNHVHFSFSKAGASGKTSYWTKVVVNVGGNPGNGGTPPPPPHGGGGPGPGGTGGSGGPGGGSGGDGDGWTPPTPPAPTLPETVDISVDDPYAQTTQALLAGHHYLVTVTGSYTYASLQPWDGSDPTPLLADAECTQQPQWTNDGFSLDWSATSDYGDWSDRMFGLSVDGRTDWIPTNDDGNGCDSSDHTYVMHVTPDRDGPLLLHIVGARRMDGEGSLSVTVTNDRT